MNNATKKLIALLVGTVFSVISGLIMGFIFHTVNSDWAFSLSSAVIGIIMWSIMNLTIDIFLGNER